MKTISISFAWLVFACSQSFADEQRPNVLFIAIDDLRNDLGSLGVAHAKTPQLDAFAKTARVFSQHYVQVPTCGASRCALMRGRYPTEYSRMIRRAYAASTSYMDEQVGRVLAALRELGMEKDTIVVVWSDHGFLLGEHAIWGKHCLYERALRSPLMIRHPGLESPGQTSAATVETVDLFPTLTDLCGLPKPNGLDGRSLRSQLTNPRAAVSKPAHSFWTGGQRTVRTDRWRLIAQPGNDAAAPQVELFDYQIDPDETRNHAETQPEIVRELLARLKDLPDPSQQSGKLKAR